MPILKSQPALSCRRIPQLRALVAVCALLVYPSPLLHQVPLHASTTGITTFAVHVDRKSNNGRCAAIYRQYYEETVSPSYIVFDHTCLLDSLAKEAKDIQADPPVGVRQVPS